ncbi:hypothetical protein SANTM175S_01549 [Streptomyces antimycoticus]
MTGVLRAAGTGQPRGVPTLPAGPRSGPARWYRTPRVRDGEGRPVLGGTQGDPVEHRGRRPGHRSCDGRRLLPSANPRRRSRPSSSCAQGRRRSVPRRLTKVPRMSPPTPHRAAETVAAAPHLAERGLRQVQRVAVVGSLRQCPRRRRGPHQGHAGRSAAGPAGRGPGHAADVRRPGLPAGRTDAARAPYGPRRRHLLRGAARMDGHRRHVTVSTEEFTALAGRRAAQPLDALFTAGPRPRACRNSPAPGDRLPHPGGGVW